MNNTHKHFFKDPNQVERLFTVIDKMLFPKCYKTYTSKDFKEVQMKLNSKPVDKEEVFELDEKTKAQEKMKIENEVLEEMLEEKQKKEKLKQQLNSLDRHFRVQPEYARKYQKQGKLS